MASTVGSTVASTTDRANQDGVNLCVTMIIQLMVYDPWMTIEEIMNYVTWIGPAVSVGGVARMFGGRENLQRTLRRMEIIRQAKIQGKLDLLPIDTEPFNGALPEIDGNIYWWAPRVIGGDPHFEHPPPGGNILWGPLHRCPHEGEYSDDYWEERENESEASLAETMLELNSDAVGEDDDINLARSEAST